MRTLAVAVVAVAIAACALAAFPSLTNDSGSPTMKDESLGNFSVSLAVKDLGASRAFYEKLGFKKVFGEASQNWLILKNGPAIIGLFQGMLEKNVLTFNPGWAADGPHPTQFEDVRDIQKRLEAQGLKLTSKADASSTGPASFMLSDPDGNMILFDQHVPKPAK